MNHQAALLDSSSNVTDDAAKALLHSQQVSEAVSKAMALILVDGTPVDLVDCRSTLYRSLDAIFSRRPYGEMLYVAMVWMPCGNPGDKVDTLYMPRDLWEALCENEDTMDAYFNITGIFHDDDDAND